jgi:hypothetical protein
MQWINYYVDFRAACLLLTVVENHTIIGRPCRHTSTWKVGNNTGHCMRTADQQKQRKPTNPYGLLQVQVLTTCMASRIRTL